MDQLLATKLYIPNLRPELVSRIRLIEQLNGGLYRKLTLISAPAGFGKTTLICHWLGTIKKDCEKENPTGYRFAWLSLDKNDNDLTRFLNYLVTALEQIDDNEMTVGGNAYTLLQSNRSLPPEKILTTLINDFAKITTKTIFVLDDYHSIDTQSIHDVVNFFIENLPPQIHLVIATREDPLVPLPRLRARDQLTELRGKDLRFSLSEAAEFLNKVMGLKLTAKDIEALENRTEGWIAGLQLVAITLQGHIDKSNLVRAFTGSHRLILDYLVEEVFNQQPEHIQTFLLKTAILDRLNGSLCDYLTYQENGQAILQYLEKTNLFIVPLDNKRKWYRYHHLFADLLLQRSNETYREQILRLHHRASEWYEENGITDKAIEHSLKALDFDRAANLVEAAWFPMNTSYRSLTWLGWAKSLPEELVRSRPVLSAAYGWALLDTGDLEAAEMHFRDAERWLNFTVNINAQNEIPSDEITEPDKDEFRSLSALIANGRAYLSQALGDLNSTLRYAQQAIDHIRENDFFELGLSDVLMGFAFWANGELEAANKAITDSVTKMRLAGNIPFVISFSSYLADVTIAQGRLHETENIYLHLLDFAKRQNGAEIKETAVLHLGLSEIYLEQGNRDAANQHLQRSEELGEQPAFPPWYRHWIHAHSRAMEVQGHFDDAITLLAAAEQLYYRHPIPDIRPLGALLARAWIRQGKLDEAQNWVRKQNLSIDDNLSYLSEFEHITLARLLIAQYKTYSLDSYISDALVLLDRLLKAAKESGRTGSIIEVSILQALAHQAQNSIPLALRSLRDALLLARPECYVQTFVSEGVPIETLLRRLKIENGGMKQYVNKLLAFFSGDEYQTPCYNGQDLIEPLSDRELEVLQLISNGLSNQQIGSQLYLSLNTVKAHTRNIYGKLGVNSRIQAVSKARTLGILLATE